MGITFIGHVSRDVDIVRGQTTQAFGGGVFHNGVTAARVGAESRVITRALAEDSEQILARFNGAGTQVTILDSPTPTSIQNSYLSDSPDSRVSRLISRAAPFSIRDLEEVSDTVIHVNPLWYPEFPPELLLAVRRQAQVLGIDAQGFLRRSDCDGTLILTDWEEKAHYLPLVDVLKVDACEARVLTGQDDHREAATTLSALGAKVVLLTHVNGVGLLSQGSWTEFAFDPYDLSCRTGRGDTFTAAYLVGSCYMPPAEAAKYATEITNKKLKYPGPYRG